MDSEMKGKICLVTGSNSGIGLETVVGLAHLGATVVMACRDSGKSRAALEEAGRRGAEDVHLMTVDLASQKSIRKFAQEFAARYPRLHVLVHNAGIVTYKRQLTADGLETQFAVNVVAPYLLTLLLRGPLRAAALSRVVLVASDSHRMGWLNWDNLQGEKRYVGLLQYGHTKLACVLLTQALAGRLAGDGISVNALHPGSVQTPMFEKATPKLLYPLVRRLLLTQEEGARTSLHLACAPQLAGVTGKYFKDCKETRPAGRALSEESAARVWEICGRLTGEQA